MQSDDVDGIARQLASLQGGDAQGHQRLVDVAERFVALIDRGDIDGLLGLLSDDIVVDDPVGIVHLEGKREFEPFFREGRPKAGTALRLTGPVRTTAGREAALPLMAELTMDGHRYAADIITTIEVGENGLICAFRAYWNPARMQPIEPTEQ